MNIITPENIPSKFRPYLLEDPLFKLNREDWKDVEIQFNSGSRTKTNRGHVVEIGDYFFKSRRSDHPGTTPDTHLYRVRKADKIRDYIEKNNLQDELVVPKKCLYWDKKEEVFYVVSQKMSLSNEVAKLRDESLLGEWKTMNFNDQRGAAIKGNPQRSFSVKQAKALADLAFSVGYYDLDYHNLFFTPQGKVAIIDTEPPCRWIKKTYGNDIIIGKEPLSTRLGLRGVTFLKAFTHDDKAHEEIEKIERTYVILCIAKLIGKTALLFFASRAIHFIPMRINRLNAIVALLPLTKIPSLLREIYKVYTAWNGSPSFRVNNLQLL